MAQQINVLSLTRATGHSQQQVVVGQHAEPAVLLPSLQTRPARA